MGMVAFSNAKNVVGITFSWYGYFCPHHKGWCPMANSPKDRNGFRMGWGRILKQIGPGPAKPQ